MNNISGIPLAAGKPCCLYTSAHEVVKERKRVVFPLNSLTMGEVFPSANFVLKDFSRNDQIKIHLPFHSVLDKFFFMLNLCSLLLLLIYILG